MDDAKKFKDIFREELQGDDFGNGSDGLRPGAVPRGASEDTMRSSVDGLKVPLAALCLSGGGIRSAAFALGVLQALARFGLLGQFDYLSTVSGGGYIGSWLSAWRYRIRQTFGLKAHVADALGFCTWIARSLNLARRHLRSADYVPTVTTLLPN